MDSGRVRVTIDSGRVSVKIDSGRVRVNMDSVRLAICDPQKSDGDVPFSHLICSLKPIFCIKSRSLKKNL